MPELEGKAALVTGGSRGIGRAICLELARRGAKVAVNYNANHALAEELVDTILGSGGEAFSVGGDVSKAEDANNLVKATIDRYFQQLQTQPVDAARLDRIKSHLRYSFALSLDSPLAVARQVGQVVWLTGDVAPLNQLWKEIEAVTPQDVQRAAQEVFQEKGMTVVTLSHPAAASTAKKEGGAR